MGSAPQSREELERIWLDRLDSARHRYALARADYEKVRAEKSDGVTPSPDGDLAIRLALQRERLALRELMHATTSFTDFILTGLTGKLPPT
jgi:hypothetical protein